MLWFTHPIENASQSHGQSVFRITYAAMWSSRERWLDNSAFASVWAGSFDCRLPNWHLLHRWSEMAAVLLSWGIAPCDSGYAWPQPRSALQRMWQCRARPQWWLCLEVSGFHRGRPEQCHCSQHPCSKCFTLVGANLDISIPEYTEVFHVV